MFLNVRNDAVSTLATGITLGATSLTVATGEGARFPTSHFHISVFVAGVPETNMEIMLCTSRVGDVLTVVRAREGTTAVGHLIGEVVELRVTAEIVEELQKRTDFVTKDFLLMGA